MRRFVRTAAPRSPIVPAKAYPNPAHGILYVDGQPGGRKPWLARLYTIGGQPLLTQQTFDDHFSMNINTCQPGVYILRLFNGAAMPVLTEKIVVE